MDKTLEFNSDTVILTLLIFAGVFLALFVVYRIFKSCIQYTSYNGWGIISIPVMLLWGIPSIIPFIIYYYTTKDISVPSWVLPAVSIVCGGWLLFMIIGTCRIMGAKYGIAVSVFRLILCSSAAVLAAYLAYAALLLLVFYAIVGVTIVEHAALVLVGKDGAETIILHKKGTGYYDQNLEPFYFLGDGTLHGYGEVFTRIGGGIWDCTNGNTYYSY